MKRNLKVIGFDADDTLWVNETYYRETEREFVKLLTTFASEKEVMDYLYATEINNLPLYGYGAKGFVLSMIETALKISKNQLPSVIIGKIVDLGKALLNKPVVLLDGAREVLQHFKDHLPIILITKGDLLDQERKLRKSGLDSCFHHIEIMSDKKEENYYKLLNRIAVKPKEFMMVGNSLKSDILPVLKLGAWGVHIPYHTTWVHEETNEDPQQWKRFLSLKNLSDLLSLLDWETSH
ncbi:Hydrolase, haloacid delahogenase-like family [hydrothermal vent metagenome]|uniref:Hydrolase, haloacid delahogenase-like family n=1 Tax=hydrothermal vent metagenome TaxID=652676 RepID=A0A3B0UFD5_9ZZZZ